MQTGTSNQQRTPLPHARRVDKPWGWEVVWAETPWYVGKILHIEAGKRLSLQYHDEKVETQCLLRGRAVLVIEDDGGELREVAMETGKGYAIRPFRRHRLVAVTDADIVEVSTPETGTTYRLEDDYARPHETEAMRRQQAGGR
jgi:mannose-6-phosphate isomerase